MRFSIRAVLVVVLVLQTLVVGAITAGLSVRHGDRTVDDLARQLTAEVNATWRWTKLCAAGLALLLLCFLCTRFLPARAPGPPLAPAAADL